MSVGTADQQPVRTEIRKQIELPFAKAFEISVKSIRIRFARSLITAAGIMLGIAFFASVRMSAEFSAIQHEIIQQKKAAIANGSLKPTEDDTRLIAAADANKEEEEAGANRMQWLSIMALIVCTVGITNAMLMSVTERYKEIGTMKCLGALDSFVVKIFFIESCLLGFISSIAGFIVGWVVIALVHIISDGPSAFSGHFWASSGTLALISAVIGTLLTFLATIAPAARAAKMPPVAALRVEV